MSLIEKSIQDVRNLDLLARGDCWIFQLDPRAKLITTLVFIFAVVSVDKYTVAQLLPFLIYPVALIGIGNLPARYFLKKICLVAPFAIMVGMFNPLLDRTILLHIGPWGISGGWISFTSILLRFALTVGSALILIAITSFNGICLALEKLRVPQVFVVQLLFLYRYLFVLADEAVRMTRARALRSFGNRGPGLKTFSSMVGCLLLKATNRAERIHLAMRCRGFDGTIRMTTETHFRPGDFFYIAGWSSLFVLFRLYNIPELLGSVAMELIA